MPPENIQTPVKIGKFKASRIIVSESWNILKQSKGIMWFPVVSSILTSLIAILVVGISFYFVGLDKIFGNSVQGSDGSANGAVFYAIFFVVYLVIFFIVNFFESGLFIVIQARFSGQTLSFKDGVRGARDNIGNIFLWSLISATVGLVLQIIADKLKFIGKIIAYFFGAAWNILTFFSLPVLVIGRTSIKDSFKESASIIRKTWGETIILKFGTGLFFGIIIFLLIALSIGLMILLPSLYTFIVVVVLLVVAIVIISIISSTLNSIFKLALFNYARTGQVPQGFSESVIKNSIN